VLGDRIGGEAGAAGGEGEGEEELVGEVAIDGGAGALERFVGVDRLVVPVWPATEQGAGSYGRGST
jgi:hypothetical protein